MDWIVLSTQAVALLTNFLPYLQEAGKEIAKEIAGDSWVKAKQLYKAVKEKAIKDKESSQLLELFEKKPELFKEALAKMLTSFAETDEDFAQLLRNLMGDFHNNNITQTAIGDGNIQVSNGMVAVNSFPHTSSKKKRK
jgi:hypothetical protein